MSELAECPNVMAKLGGLCMPDNGYGYMHRDLPPSSDEIVETQGKWYAHMLDVFGPERCMFESNFPVDKISCSYNVLWNSFKRITSKFSEGEKRDLYHDVAVNTYGISEALTLSA